MAIIMFNLNVTMADSIVKYARKIKHSERGTTFHKMISNIRLDDGTEH